MYCDGGNPFLFRVGKKPLYLQQIKKKWARTILDIGLLEPHRYRLHGGRKGFATTLLNNGVPMSLIAFAGRWKLHAAIYRYLIHTQKDLLPLAKMYLYGKQKKSEMIDMDETEIDLIDSLRSKKRRINEGFFDRTEALHSNRL